MSISKSKTISDRLAGYGITYRKDERTELDGGYSLFDETGFVARVSAKEACFFLDDLDSTPIEGID